MIIHDSDAGWPEPDGGNLRLALMAGALAVAAVCGAVYAEIQSLLG